MIYMLIRRLHRNRHPQTVATFRNESLLQLVLLLARALLVFTLESKRSLCVPWISTCYLNLEDHGRHARVYEWHVCSMGRNHRSACKKGKNDRSLRWEGAIYNQARK